MRRKTRSETSAEEVRLSTNSIIISIGRGDGIAWELLKYEWPLIEINKIKLKTFFEVSVR